MPNLSDKDKKYISEAFEQAALDAGFNLSVRAGLGDTLEFNDVAGQFGSSLAMNLAFDMATSALKRQGINLSFGGGHFDSNLMPDRYTLIIDGKRIYGAVRWEF